MPQVCTGDTGREFINTKSSLQVDILGIISALINVHHEGIYFLNEATSNTTAFVKPDKTIHVKYLSQHTQHLPSSCVSSSSSACWCYNPIRVKCQRRADQAASYSTLKSLGCGRGGVVSRGRVECVCHINYRAPMGAHYDCGGRI